MGNCITCKTKKTKAPFSESIFKPYQQSTIKINKTGPIPEKRKDEEVHYIADATKEVRRLYNVQQKLLGAGAFGKVYLAESREDAKIKFAIKILNTRKMNPQLVNQMQNELKILYKLDHPYICNYIESFEDDKNIYIIMEYC